MSPRQSEARSKELCEKFAETRKFYFHDKIFDKVKVVAKWQSDKCRQEAKTSDTDFAS